MTYLSDRDPGLLISTPLALSQRCYVCRFEEAEVPEPRRGNGASSWCEDMLHFTACDSRAIQAVSEA